MKKITAEDIQQMDTRYRATLINSLAGYKQPVLVGTCSTDGQDNLALFNSLMHVGANPPLYGLLFRPDTIRRDTLRNIVDTGAYTLNWINAEHISSAHQTAAKYEAHESEFPAVGFHPVRDEKNDPPRVAEAVISAKMKVEQIADIPLNGTRMVIGSVQIIYLPESLVRGDGFVALHELDIPACVGLDAYYKVKPLVRLSYPRPGLSLHRISFDDV